MSPVFAALSNLNMAIPYIFTARFPEKESATLWLCIGNNIVGGWVGGAHCVPAAHTLPTIDYSYFQCG